jgi:membrane-associated phospholipid phosphatase
MIDWLKTWDEAAFRAIHSAGRSPALAPLALAVTDMGLAHAQLVPLLLARLRRRMPGWTPLLWIIGLGLMAAAYEGFIEHQNPAEFATTAAAFFGCTALFWRLPERWCSGAIYAAAAAGLVRNLIRPLAPRWRPSNLEFADAVEPLFGRSSFPSGHAATTFAIAVFLLWAARGTKRAMHARAIAFWSLLVGLSRIAVGVHYPTDVLASLALATAAATAVFLLLEKRLGDQPSRRRRTSSASAR